MAYPFAPCFRWGPLKQKLIADFGCTFVALPVPRIERRVGNAIMFYVVRQADTDQVAWGVLRVLLRRLKLPPGDFNLPLG